MDMFDAEKIVNAGITELEIRSVMTCRAHVGVCARCYGSNMSNGQCVKVGESVGIIAAESIGEPGTQLTMRTFHTGGIASAEDITQGLPRVEELFESRRPEGHGYHDRDWWYCPHRRHQKDPPCRDHRRGRERRPGHQELPDSRSASA